MLHMDSTVEMVLVMEAQESLPQGCGISATDADTCLLESQLCPSLADRSAVLESSFWWWGVGELAD